MPAPTNTLLIEGSFVELAEELAQYIDTINKVEDDSGLKSEIAPVLQQIRDVEQPEGEQNAAPNPAHQDTVIKLRDEALKKLVAASSVLNAALEKEFTAAYNLLIYLVNQSPQLQMFLPRICQHLSQPVTGSPQFGASLAIQVLTTLFNTLHPSSQNRYHVFLALLNVIRSNSSAQAFDSLTPQLVANVPKWLSMWNLDEEDTRSLYLSIADVAQVSGDKTMAYEYILKALDTIPADSASETDSRELAVRAISTALINPTVFDFNTLTSSDAIQALRKSDSSLFELLEIFASADYADYADFLETTSLDSIDLASSAEALTNKIRLLSLASLAAGASNRSLPYSVIASALQVPSEDVEMWVIDTIRAGLVEGKLSQSKQEFLVQRATYRVFGEKQWREIQGRLMVWRRSLEGVLGVITSEKEKFLREQAAEAAGQGQGQAPSNGYNDRRQGRGQRQPREQAADFVNGD
ncbi:putative pci domain protein [Phaeomoniella chlamydospora]|uniref:Eukaryotic translation initiation factor 3 subunit M n=1 Tax=Phaeomoniella chlamydospora TaxID=158046 RepID=A0A0G2HLC2_PHACM|nr:putative pci domain protein [Phaeomoniella chlamydospora]